MKTLIVTLALIGLLSTPVQAGRCVIRSRAVVVQKAFVVQQAIAVPVVADYYYQVSQSLQIESLIRKAVREELGAMQHAQQVQPLPTIAQNCSKCHSGPNPKGEVIIDGLTPLDTDTAVRAQLLVRDGKMPKDHQLSPEQLSEVMHELLDLTVRPSVPQSVPPAPEIPAPPAIPQGETP